MILGFKQKFADGTPTYFREKILVGIDRPEVKAYSFGNKGLEIIPFGNAGTRTYKVWESSEKGFIHVQDLVLHPKLHTFREDPHDRWKAGMSIQMVYRGPKYSIADHFNKGIPELEKCKSIQKIGMKWSIRKEALKIFIDHKLFAVIPCAGNVHVNEPFLSNGVLLAHNDGFDNTRLFVNWFNKDWQGKIIHFTDLRY